MNLTSARVVLLALVGSISYGQPAPFPSLLTPGFLYVGSGPTQLNIFNPSYGVGLTALWNGSPRRTSPSSSGVGYSIALTAADLATPQLAVITLIDSQSDAVVDTVNCPVGYNFRPSGVAFDSTKNRLYVATPHQTADPRFPPNSVVVLDLTTGAIGPVLNTGSAMGDVALSDDGNTLYVVVEGDNLVRRIDPSTLTPSGDFYFRPMGTKSAYPNLTARDTLSVMPGHPGTVALEFSPQVGITVSQVAIFDNGIKRPNTITTTATGISPSSSMLFSPDAKYLFLSGGANFSSGSNSNSQLATFRYLVDSTGIPTQKAPFASGGGPVAIVGETLYTSYSNPLYAIRLATAIDYPSMEVTNNFAVGGPIAVEPSSQRAFVLYTPGALGRPIQLVAFDLPTLDPLGTQTVGIEADSAVSDSERLIRFGTDGFILSSTAGLLIFHSPLTGTQPTISAAGVGNAASQQPGPIAPGELLSIYGNNLGPSTPTLGSFSASGTLPSSLADVQVWFGRLPGALLMASQSQINVVAPFELQPGTTVDLQVWHFGIPSAKVSIPVVTAAPALVTRNGSGAGPVAMINQDQSVNAPAPAGTIVALFGTGGGALAGAIDGEMAREPVILSGTVHVSVGGRDAQVIYAGAAPGLINGAFQLNIQIPDGTPSGNVPITVSVNGQDSPEGATIEIR